MSPQSMRRTVACNTVLPTSERTIDPTVRTHRRGLVGKQRELVKLLADREHLKVASISYISLFRIAIDAS